MAYDRRASDAKYREKHRDNEDFKEGNRARSKRNREDQQLPTVHLYAIELVPNSKRFKTGMCTTKRRLLDHKITLGTLEGLICFEDTGIPRDNPRKARKLEKKLHELLELYCTRVEKSEVFDAENALVIKDSIKLIIGQQDAFF